MEIVFTDKCKDKIIHSENGIKFNIKGYVLYSDEIVKDNVPELDISDIDFKKIIAKDEVTNIKTLRTNAFDITYIPALESSILTNEENDESSLNIIAAKMGHYEIDINKGLTDKEFSSILIIGEEFGESDKYVFDKHKIYLAAVITNVEPNLEKPQKIIFKISFTNFKQEEINESLRLIDYNFNEFTKNEIIKDFNTIQLPDNYTLTPDKKNTDYDAEINIIKFDSEEGANNVKSFPSNLVLLDKSEKINNVWNTAPRVVVGLDNYDKKVITPHIELSYGLKEPVDNTFITNSIDIQYDRKHIAINQNTGIDKLQVDILPEDIDEENRRCIKKRIKRSNLFDYSLVSANKAFFKFDSLNSRYNEGTYNIFEFQNRNNTFATDKFPVEYQTLIYSNDNGLSGNNYDNLFLNSDSNKIGYSFVESTFVNSSGTNFVNKGVSYEEGSIEPIYNNEFDNNVFIGTDTVDALNTTKITFSNNVTMIGSNKLSTYCVEQTNTIPLTDEFNNIPSYIKPTNSDTEVEVNLDTNFKTKGYSFDIKIGYESLIGFSGLSVDRLPTEHVFYNSKSPIGYDKKTKTQYYYYSNPSYEQNSTYCVKFGNYNANYNTKALSGYVYDSVTNYMNDGTEYSNTFSSRYSTPPKTFDAETTKLYKLYFKNQHDSLYNKNTQWNSLSADEGDFSINKLVVVGNGYDILGKNITGYSPAQMASYKYKAGQYCKKIDLFSVEKDSFQLVHSDANTQYKSDRPRVYHFPGIFAVRSTVPVRLKKGKYKDEYHTNFNKYNLQNAIYTTKGIFTPRRHTSNDVYPLSFETLNDFANNGGDNSNVNESYSYDTLKENLKNRTTFVFPCNGIEKNKAISYDVYMSDIIKDLNTKYKKFGIEIKQTDKKGGTNKTLYTIYLVNTSTEVLKFHPDFRFNNSTLNPNNLSNTEKELNPGDCIEILYTDYGGAVGGTKVGGVLNFDYNNK